MNMLRYRHFVAAEWLKLFSLRSTSLLLAAMVAIAVASAWNAGTNVPSDPSIWPRIDPMAKAFDQDTWQLLLAVAAVFGALGLAGEHTSGLIRTTFAAAPDRRTMVLAKATVVTVTLLVTGIVSAVAAFAVSQAELRSVHVGVSIGHAGAFRAVTGSALILPVAGLVGLGVGAVIRHVGGSVGGTLALLTMLPQILGNPTAPWAAHLVNAFPVTAWQTLADHGFGPPTQTLPPSVAASALALAAWTVVGLGAAVFVTDRRDV